MPASPSACHISLNSTSSSSTGRPYSSQGLPVAAEAVDVNLEVLGAAEVGDAAAALLQQVLGGLVAALEIVQLHGIDLAVCPECGRRTPAECRAS